MEELIKKTEQVAGLAIGAGLDVARGDYFGAAQRVAVGVGAGLAADVPSAATAQSSAGQANYVAILGSFSGLFDKKADAVEERGQAVISKSLDDFANNMVVSANNLVAKSRTVLAAKVEKLESVIKKTEDMVREQKKANFWSKIGAAFSALGAVLSMALGAVLCATAVGAPLGAMAMAGGAMVLSGVLGVIMTADSITALRNDGKGFLPEAAQYAMMGAMLVCAVVSVAGMFAAGASALAESAKLVMVLGMATAANQAVGAVTSIISNAATMKAANRQADAGRLNSDATFLQAVTEQLKEYTDIFIKKYAEESRRMNGLVGENLKSLNDNARTYSKMLYA
ncbi:Secretion system effector C (SseC) like family protein [Labrenzia sp. THAF82]|uniref:hypothetical protein n=1 Tax=Labrenzia sp. THAF82 TaxID=2587861 RepID=UPI001267F743|nr:hypothetical protein [Labrenzia sp. THAF82]QFT34040.1 Secretion system effector C (SseC) like family protein [Labrenzia sp. THAF82]